MQELIMSKANIIFALPGINFRGINFRRINICGINFSGINLSQN